MSRCAKRAEGGMGRVGGKGKPARKAPQSAFLLCSDKVN